MSTTSNALNLAKAWERRAQAIAPLMREATRDATDTFLFESKMAMERLIYNKPVPQKDGKPAWIRTGKLQRSEKRILKGDYLGIVYNNAESEKKGKKYKYARRRHEMKSRFPAPWRTEAEKIASPKIRKIYHDAIRKALKSGLLPGKV